MIEQAKQIRLLLLDVDGVLTDGGITLDNNGIESKTFNVRDGHGIKLLQRYGIMVGIITGRSSDVVAHRCRELGIEILYQGAKDKRIPYGEIKTLHALSDNEIAYMGDDIVDLPILKQVGLAATVADADRWVQEEVMYVSPFPGGGGAVRDLCEKILEAQGKWQDILKGYLR